MRLHVVTVLATGQKTYHGSHQEAVSHRQEIMSETGQKRSAIDLGQVEVPTTKKDLIAWLNSRG